MPELNKSVPCLRSDGDGTVGTKKIPDIGSRSGSTLVTPLRTGGAESNVVPFIGAYIEICKSLHATFREY